MLRTPKPKKGRVRRVLKERESQIVENPKTAIFIRGTKTSQIVQEAMQELSHLKKPHSIAYNKRNPVRPFEAEGIESIRVYSEKTDASLCVVGTHSKKRPHALTFLRLFDGAVLDILELGIDRFVSMKAFPGAKAALGMKPLMLFSGALFDDHPTYMHLKSMFLDFFRGETLTALNLAGVSHVISISAGPLPEGKDSGPDGAAFRVSEATGTTTLTPESFMQGALPLSETSAQTTPPGQIYFRVYLVKLHKTGTKLPRVELLPMGPSIDLSLGRVQSPDAERLKKALKRPRETASANAAEGLELKKKKNKRVDEMGDRRGQIHLGRQDLGQLQLRKRRALQHLDSDDEDGDDDRDAIDEIYHGLED